MGVTFAATELPYAHAVARYGCRCGAVALRHGRHLQAPAGWLEAGTESDDAAEYLCPRCAEVESAESAAGAAGRSAT